MGFRVVCGCQYGYIAPEQFQNRASSRSDLYSLGASLLFLLSGNPPSAFPQVRLRVAFRLLVPMRAGLADVVERCLEAVEEDRFESADEVKAALLGRWEAPPSAVGVVGAGKAAGVIRKPPGSAVVRG